MSKNAEKRNKNNKKNTRNFEIFEDSHAQFSTIFQGLPLLLFFFLRIFRRVPWFFSESVFFPKENQQPNLGVSPFFFRGKVTNSIGRETKNARFADENQRNVSLKSASLTIIIPLPFWIRLSKTFFVSACFGGERQVSRPIMPLCPISIQDDPGTPPFPEDIHELAIMDYMPLPMPPLLLPRYAFAFLPRRLLTPRFGAGLARFLRSTSWPCPHAFSLRVGVSLLCAAFSATTGCLAPQWSCSMCLPFADLCLSLLLLALVLGGCFCLRFSGASTKIQREILRWIRPRCSCITSGQSRLVKGGLQAGCLAPLPC